MDHRPPACQITCKACDAPYSHRIIMGEWICEECFLWLKTEKAKAAPAPAVKRLTLWTRVKTRKRLRKPLNNPWASPTDRYDLWATA